MSLRIFETDPDAKPRPRNVFMDDIVGRFRGGMLVGRRPVALAEWRVTTDDPDVADRIAELFGGTAEEWDTDRADNRQVMTETAAVSIVIEQADHLRARMVLLGLQGPVHQCDGMYSLADDDRGEPCGCPRSLQERKDKAKSGKGPRPDISLKFRLADDPELGYFLFGSGSWTLVSDLPELENQLAQAGGPVQADLKITHVAYTTKAGRDVEYHRPEIVLKGAVSVPLAAAA
ncbi:recombination directionality factor [Crossiella sp. CA198]|uniref:recombination directionality factor n=1 Tax=Crossiella sp. CA198 TaxID=3455607 RepID=UPI003F8D1EA9